MVFSKFEKEDRVIVHNPYSANERFKEEHGVVIDVIENTFSDFNIYVLFPDRNDAVVSFKEEELELDKNFKKEKQDHEKGIVEMCLDLVSGGAFVDP